MRPYRYSVYRVRFGKLRTPKGRPYKILPLPIRGFAGARNAPLRFILLIPYLPDDCRSNNEQQE